MRNKLVVGNWKMHGTRESAHQLMSGVASDLPREVDVEVVLCVPFPFLDMASRTLAGTQVAWGAQALSEHREGAHTGEVSAQMLKDFGCSYVIVGHSERRSDNGETDAVVAAKTRAALDADLTPIICVGETLADRESGRTGEVILRQFDTVVSILAAAERTRCVFAYEPVWAVGTGHAASPQQAAEAHGTLRDRLAEIDATAAQEIRIVYGGSVKPSSAAELFSQPGIDGGLIGGASLVAADFLAIVAAASATHPVSSD